MLTFKFDQLSDIAKQKDIDWYREASQYGNYFAENVIEDAKTIGALFGLDIDRVFYSGFSSQGDGACFEGSYRYQKGALKAVKQHAPQDIALHNIVKSLQETQSKAFYKLAAKCTQRGHYMHSGCMSVDVYHIDDEYRDIGKAEDNITESLRAFANWIYKQLEQAYDYENSDEQIIETIIANEYEFNADGSKA